MRVSPSGFTGCRRSSAPPALCWQPIGAHSPLSIGAALAALMMVGSTLLGAEARLARADAMLLFTVVAAMSVLARAYLFSRDDKIARPGWALLTVFWTALAAGILVKGLVIVMIVGLTA